MTESEFQKVENLLRASAANMEHCRKVIVRSSALVDRAKKLIQFFEENRRNRNAWTSKKSINDALGRVFFLAGASTSGKSNSAEPNTLNL